MFLKLLQETRAGRLFTESFEHFPSSEVLTPQLIHFYHAFYQVCFLEEFFLHFGGRSLKNHKRCGFGRSDNFPLLGPSNPRTELHGG